MENYSYISLLTNDTYVYGILLLSESLKRVKSKYPLNVLITEDVSIAVRELLNQCNISYQLVEKYSMSKELYEHNYKIYPRFTATWKDCFTKYNIFKLTQFSKIIFLDADILVLKNLDHLFKKPHMTAALDGEYFNIWPGQDHFNAGCLVIEPSEEEFNNILNFIKEFDYSKITTQVLADQEFLNLYYKEWVNKKELHLNKYYNIFAPYIQDDQIKDIEKNCYFIHFVGRKPWVFWVKDPNETYTEYFYEKAKEYIIPILSKDNINWDKIREKLKLTSYAICKNEVDNVEKWLKGFGQADYVCILDTGSTDGTWEKLQEMQKQYPNLIINQKIISPWRFDVARNESMKLIPKDSIIQFMADLDEEIKTPNWVAKIKSVWDPLFSRGMYNYHRDVLPGDIIQRTIKEYRIHSKEWTHWENIVHECIVKDDGERRFYQDICTPVDIEVWHYPKGSKQVDYAELCEAELKEHPENSLMELQLAIEYEIKEEDEKAFIHYQNLIKTTNNLQLFELARCYSGFGQIFQKKDNIPLALNIYREGRLIDPTFADNYMKSAQIYYNNKEYKKAIELCLDALKNCPEAYWCSVYDKNSYYIYELLGLCYYLNNEKESGLAYLFIASTKNPDDKELENLIIEIVKEMTQ